MRAKDFDTSGFSAWLRNEGAVVQETTNAYEVMRYAVEIAGKKRTFVVYRNAKGQMTVPPETVEHYLAFKDNRHLIRKTTRVKSQALREKLLERDGDRCWFCGGRMKLEQMSLEHLVPKSRLGPDNLYNTVLVHRSCNLRLGDKSVAEKVLLRDEERARQKTEKMGVAA